MQFSITTIITIITVLVSLGGFSNRKIIDDLIFSPPAIAKQNQWYRFFSHGLIHADLMHLAFNMLAFYSFGNQVEDSFTQLFGPAGNWIYLAMYISALLVSILPTYFKNRDNYQYRSLGASGAVSAVIFAAVLLYPTASIMFFVFPMRSFVFAFLYLAFTAFMDRRGGDNINHSAHLWGSLYGLAFLIVACQFVGFPVVQRAIEQVQNFL